MIRLDVRNDGTGNHLIGNYDVSVALPREVVYARVENFPRELGAYELLLLAVRAVERASKDRTPGG